MRFLEISLVMTAALLAGSERVANAEEPLGLIAGQGGVALGVGYVSQVLVVSSQTHAPASLWAPVIGSIGLVVRAGHVNCSHAIEGGCVAGATAMGIYGVLDTALELTGIGALTYAAIQAVRRPKAVETPSARGFVLPSVHVESTGVRAVLIGRF